MTDLVIERTFAASPETVYDFVTRNDHLLKWWGPEGMTIPEHTLDFTQTGPWSSVMMNSEGQGYKVTGEVTAVDPPKSVEFTWAWHDENDERGHESRVRFDIKSDGNGGTHFTMTHSGLPDDEARENHKQGWTSSLRKLERMAN